MSKSKAKKLQEKEAKLKAKEDKLKAKLSTQNIDEKFDDSDNSKNTELNKNNDAVVVESHENQPITAEHMIQSNIQQTPTMPSQASIDTRNMNRNTGGYVTKNGEFVLFKDVGYWDGSGKYHFNKSAPMWINASESGFTNDSGEFIKYSNVGRLSDDGDFFERSNLANTNLEDYVKNEGYIDENGHFIYFADVGYWDAYGNYFQNGHPRLKPNNQLNLIQDEGLQPIKKTQEQIQNDYLKKVALENKRYFESIYSDHYGKEINHEKIAMLDGFARQAYDWERDNLTTDRLNVMKDQRYSYRRYLKFNEIEDEIDVEEYEAKARNIIASKLPSK